jgi:hypothetical protein
MIESIECYIKDTHEPPRHEHHIDEQSIEEQEQTVASEAREASEASTEPKMSSSSAEYARIDAQFNTNVPILTMPQQFPQHPHTPRTAQNTPRPVPQAQQQPTQPQQPQQQQQPTQPAPQAQQPTPQATQQAQRHFNIADKIIDKIDDERFLVKISFHELMEYAAPITFNRDLDEEQIEKLYVSIVEDYIPFTMDAIYDTTSKIDEKSIKIINGNHRRAAICKYITEHDNNFSCDYKVYVWIYVVDDCESSNIQRSINLYTKINNHLPFKAPIVIAVNVMEFLNRLCKHKFKGKAIMANTRDTSHQPKINKNELYKLFDANKDILERFVSIYSVNTNNLIITDAILDKFIANIEAINKSIWLKGITNVYSSSLVAENKKVWEKALEIGFFLNLKNSLYSKEVWIKHLCDPSSI